MRIQDIIRSMIDIIDGIQQPEQPSATIVIAQPTEEPGEDSPLTHAGDDINRWRQIVDLADTDNCGSFANEPNEKVADIDSVTVDAGGGINGPKNPSDLRGDHVSLYPAHQHGVR